MHVYPVNYSKLTIFTRNGQKGLTVKNPIKETVYDAIIKYVPIRKSEDIITYPSKLKNKLMKKKFIPDFINKNTFIGSEK